MTMGQSLAGTVAFGALASAAQAAEMQPCRRLRRLALKGELIMRQLFLPTMAAAIIASPALAADIRAPVMKAPPAPAPVYNWTGCYVAGGGGYGMLNQEITKVDTGGPANQTLTSGSRGWFGTAGGGCDLQVGERWVIGAFADYDFADIKGDLIVPIATTLGGRIGYLITPAVLTYVSGGFTEARFSTVNLVLPTLPPSPFGLHFLAHTYSGWFLGSGYEYNLNWLPGLFWRTEYRYARYGRDSLPFIFSATGERSAAHIDSEKFVQNIRTELVWRWNWGGRY